MTQVQVEPAFDLRRWVEDRAHQFAPPVGNLEIWRGNDQLTFMISMGPNARNDFHINPSEEIFYQIQGSIRVDWRTADGSVKSVAVGSGEVLRLPAMVPHCPLRPAGTWGIVIQRARLEGEEDGIRWYCPSCGGAVHEAWFGMHDIGAQVKDVLAEFNGDMALRTCKSCGHVHEIAGLTQDVV